MQTTMKPNIVTNNIQDLLVDLKSCSIERDLPWGRTVHAKALEKWRAFDAYVVSSLMNMYGKCGSMMDARELFDNLGKPNLVQWNTLLSGYVENGEGQITLHLFSMVKTFGYFPDSFTYVAAFKACIALAEDGDYCLNLGRKIHSEMNCQINHYLHSTLIQMYCKCNSIVEGRDVFNSIQDPNVVSWNAMILGYAENGEGNTSLELFSRMKESGHQPDSVTFIGALKGCTSLITTGKEACLERVRGIHCEIGFPLAPQLQGTLIDMYSKCGSMIEARKVFNSVCNPNVVIWNALLLGYVENGLGDVSLDLFSKMKATECKPDCVTYIAVFKACTFIAVNGDHKKRKECLEMGRAIHSEIKFQINAYLQSTMIYMYSKCKSMVDACQVFDSIQKPNVLQWSVLMLGYVENEEGSVALDLFSEMKAAGCTPDSATYIAALKACTSIAVSGNGSGKQSCLKCGVNIHSEIDHYVQGTLIDMYSKGGSTSYACRTCDNIEDPKGATWNALLSGYANSGEGCTASDLFSRMKLSGGMPDSVSYAAALKVCSSLRMSNNGYEANWCLDRGREIHSEIGIHSDSHVEATLIDMYSKCNSMEDAHGVFDNIKRPDVVSWNALLLGYVENREGHIVLKLLSRMRSSSNCAPDSLTYIAALKACGLVGALALGRTLHSEITVFSPQMVTCLVDFYAKCGSMLEAREVFEFYPGVKDVTSWTALLSGYGRLGDSASAFSLFEAMQKEKLHPDAVTFVCLLLCCSHAGLVEKARELFEAMPSQYGVAPTVIHYSCMVDVLGRGNKLKEALRMVREMPYFPDAVFWRTLLGACRVWKNVEIGIEAFQALVEMDQKNASPYYLMAQIYGSRGMWKQQKRVLEARMKVEINSPI